MERDVVGLVEEAIAAWNRRDADGFLALVTDDVEYVNAPTALEAGTRTGHEALARVLVAQWEGLGADARQRIAKTHRVDDGVVAEVTLSRTLPGSPAEIRVSAALRFTFAGDRIRRLEVLGAGTHFREGLAAAGIRDA